MKVMKFGGASVKDADAVRNLASIVREHEDIMLVVSAMGKTTNALERLAELAIGGQEAETVQLLKTIRGFHHDIVSELLPERPRSITLRSVDQFFAEIERIIRGILLLNDSPARTEDRILSYGELLSTAIVADFLAYEQLSAEWLDARELIKTDASFQHASVLWSTTEGNVKAAAEPLLERGHIPITQGYIASTIDGRTTTLGREGSDYTAAILGAVLQAEEIIIWKDVPGVMSADPKRDPAAVKIDRLSYEEAVEMTFYGASVIHPKTIKPLQNHGIPLRVRSFLDRTETGTLVGPAPDGPVAKAVPCNILKRHQVLLILRPRDFSFMDEQHIRQVFHESIANNLAINLIQHSAIGLQLVAEDDKHAISGFTSVMNERFSVEIAYDLMLQTLLNWAPEEVDVPQGALLVQGSRDRYHFLLPDEA